MLTDHETRPDRDVPRDGEMPRALTDTHDAQHVAQTELPALEEPSWLDDDVVEDMEPPRDSAFRGIWIGVAAAAATFVLVFAIPHWLGWYDLGKPGERVTREESVISTGTARPSTGDPAEEARAETAVQPAPPPTTAKISPPAAPAPTPAPPAAVTPQDTQPTAPVRATAPASVTAKGTAPEKPAKAAAASKKTYSVQIAAFKDAKPANRLANRVKRDGYRADVRRVDSTLPWVVRVGGYTSREQAESARDALARKGFRGGFIL